MGEHRVLVTEVQYSRSKNDDVPTKIFQKKPCSNNVVSRVNVQVDVLCVCVCVCMCACV